MSAPIAVSQHRRLARQHGADRFERLLGLTLLNEPDERVDDDHAQDDRGIGVVVQEEGHDGCDQEDVDQRIVKLQQEPHERPAALGLGQTIGAILGKPPLGLLER